MLLSHIQGMRREVSDRLKVAPQFFFDSSPILLKEGEWCLCAAFPFIQTYAWLQ